MSHPVRVRGLKPNEPVATWQKQDVAPRAGAWIETASQRPRILWPRVAPRAGAWIETQHSIYITVFLIVAPRAGAWIETQLQLPIQQWQLCRTPCGCVD